VKCRYQFASLLIREKFDGMSQLASGIVTPLKIAFVRVRQSDSEAARLVKLDGMAGAFCKVFEKLDAVRSELQGELVAIEVSGLTGRERCGSTADRAAIDQYDVLMSGIGEVKGGAGAEYSTADDDHVRSSRKSQLSFLRIEFQACHPRSNRIVIAAASET
jgi:hypothetical protein